MLLCSPVSVPSLSSILLGILIFYFSLQDHLSLPLVSHCLVVHIPFAFYASAFYALCTMSIPCTIPLLCISGVVHSSFYTPESLTTIASPLFFFLHPYSLYATCACSLSMLLHAPSMSSALRDHNCHSSASLVVRSMCPSSLGVKTRFLSLSGS
jgi:hypothetical protein